MAAGSITVDLLLSSGRFETDTARAGKSLKKFQKDAEAAGKAIGLAFTGAVVGVGALVKNSIDAADHLNDLSKKTGIAADTLGGIGFAASQAGGDIESATAAAGKLNKSLAEAAAGNPIAADAFKALGINVLDAAGNTKKADVALAEIADKFAGYADGPEKAALALRIFGKAGADIIPLLDDGGKALLDNIDYFKRYSGVTVDTAEKADQFNDTLGKIKLLAGAFGQTLASEALPLLQSLADKFLGAKEQGDGFKTGAEGIVAVLKGIVIAGAYVVDTFQGIGREIGAIAAQGVALAHLDFKGFTAIGDAVKEDGVRAKNELDKFVSNVLNPALSGSAGPTKPSGGTKPAAPRLPSTNAASDASESLKKQLDGQLKLIQEAEKAQADAYKIGQSFLDGVYEDGLISQKDYFAAQKNLRDANLQNALDAIDKEIAAQKAFAANPAAKPGDRVSAEEKIKLAVQQRSEAVTAASGAEILANQANTRAALQLLDAYDNLRASIMSAHGDDAGAQAIKDAQALRQAAILIRETGGDPKTLDDLKAIQQQQQQRNDIEKAYGKLLDDTSRREAEIYLDAQAGGKGELETLAAIRDARQAAIAQLGEQAQAAANLAAQSGTDADKKRAADLALAFKKAGAEIDPLATKFNGIFEDSFANAFTGFIDGSKSAKEAFRDFAGSVLSEINKITAQQLAKSLFGDTGGSSGIGGLLSSAFGSSSGGWLSSIGGLFGGGYGVGGTGAGASLLASDTLSSTGGSFADAFASGLIPMASGTNRVPKDGPFMLHRDEAVVPAKFNPALHQQPAMPANAPQISVTQHFAINGPASRSTQDQIAAAALRGAQRALTRNG